MDEQILIYAAILVAVIVPSPAPAFSRPCRNR